MLSAAAGLVLSTSSADAANSNYTQGDLVLYFQQLGGANTFMVDLGAASSFRNVSSNLINITNIGTELSNGTTGFGSSWYDLGSLYMGAAGVRSSSTATAVVNGDSNRTIYLGQSRTFSTTLGTEGTAASSGYLVGANSSMTNASTSIIQMANRLDSIASGTKLAEGTGSSFIDDTNLFVNSTTQGTAYTVFPGGVQTAMTASTLGSFGGVSNVQAALDIYRIVAVNNQSGEVNGSALRTGDFEGTVVVDTSGNVSFIVATAVPEPTTATALVGLATAAMSIRRRRRATASA